MKRAGRRFPESGTRWVLDQYEAMLGNSELKFQPETASHHQTGSRKNRS